MRQNVAKINLEIRKCEDCPFVRQKEELADWFCVYDLKHPGMRVNEKTIPDWCPFVLERLQKALDTMQGVNVSTIPKRWIDQVERRQKDHPDPKFGADHAWGHISRVTAYGIDFLEQCVGFGLLSNNEIQRLDLLLKIAAMLHDVGLSETSYNHSTRSSEMSRKYLTSKNIDLDEQDVNQICHAIWNHSKGHETRNMLDAALLLGDKMDITKHRMLRITDAIIAELTKVEKVEYDIVGKLFAPTGAELRYYTSGNFDISKLKVWHKAVIIPMKITNDFLHLPDFKFIVDGEEIDVRTLV